MSTHNQGPVVNTNNMLINAITALTRALERQDQHLTAQDQRNSRERIQANLDQQNIMQQRSRRDFVAPIGPFGDALGRGRQSMTPASDFGGDLSQMRQELEAERRPTNQARPYTGGDFMERLGSQGARGMNRFRPGNLGRALGEYGSPRTGEPSASASTAPDAQGTGNAVIDQIGVHRGATANPDDPTSVLTTALLGEHAGPAFIRNMQMERFALHRNLGWAQNATSSVLTQDEQGNPAFDTGTTTGQILDKIPGINPSRVSQMQGALNLALEHPTAAYGAYRAVQGLRHIAGAIGTNARDWQEQGAALGLNANNGTGLQGMYRFGVHNPLSYTSDATRVGAGFEVERMRLEGRLPGGGFGGQSLSSAQAQQTVQELAGQGWGADETITGQGTNARIAERFMAPLLQQNRGLAPADLAQFTPVLRNGGADIRQLSSALGDLGDAAQSTHETVSQAASTLDAFANETQGMGSHIGRLATGQSLRQQTGMDPQLIAPLMRTGVFQAQMLQQGILPSGIADASPGTTGTAALASIQMLQRATQGFHRDVYNAQGVRTMSGKMAQIDQIAQMSGMDTATVQRYMANEGRIGVRSQVATALGSGGLGDGTGTGTGIYSLFDRHAGIPAEERYWQQNVASHYQQLGLNAGQIRALNKTSDLRSRATLLGKDMDQLNRKDLGSQVGSDTTKVQIAFKGKAAQMLQVVGVTPAKALSNAAQGQLYNKVVNSPQGDLGVNRGMINALEQDQGQPTPSAASQ